VKVPLLDLKAQLKTIDTELKQAVLDVIDSTNYIMGPKIEELENKISEFCQVKHSIAVSSGTDALLIALMALDIKAGDLVITTPYSFFASAGVIARLGATPVFVEIDPDTFNMCPNKLAEWIEQNKNLIKQVKAIIPIHLFGQCADLDPIIKLANEHCIPVIEDSAQAIGATYPSNYPSKEGTKKSGSLGLIGCFSFFPSKNLGGIGDGGIVTTNNDNLAEKLKKLRVHGSKPKYYHSLIGGNFRLDPIQAAVILVKLPHLNSWNQKRQENAHYYDEIINIDKIKKPKIAYRRENHIYNQYVLTVSEKRDELRTFLTENNIGNEVYYPVPFHEQECFKYLGYKTGDFPISEYNSKHSIAIPIYPELTREMQDYVVSKLKEFYE
jgi:dTDP-4-amino-4,6-dideoxygalactose transaminase